jgi:hypothetical protein
MKLHKLKVKVPAKVIGNVTDKMGHFMDFVGAVKGSHEIKESKWKEKVGQLDFFFSLFASEGLIFEDCE